MIDTPAPFAVCTIIASNYFTRALVLNDSLRKHHPEAQFWILLIDDIPITPQAEQSVTSRGIQLLRATDLGFSAEELAILRFIYDLTEISTAYKPWTIEAVIRRTGLDTFYIDPDIQFFRRMDGLVQAVRSYDAVLTPHAVKAIPRDQQQPSESDIMGCGIYNLGFIGVNHQALRLTDWWQERLKRECYNSPSEQRFTDQRWIDFAPSLFECFISKDETCNVAYWNADSRLITQEDGVYLVNGQPLTFYHYSGLDERKPYLLSRYHGGKPRVLLSQHPTLAQLVRGYIDALDTARQESADVSDVYPYSYLSGGEKVPLVLRRVFLNEVVRAELKGTDMPVSPFGPEGEDAFLKWLLGPDTDSDAAISVPRIALRLRDLRPDVIYAFPDPKGKDALPLIHWFNNWGIHEFGLPKRYTSPLPTSYSQEAAPATLTKGIEVVGYLRTESGLGHTGRLLTLSLEHADLPYSRLVDTTPVSRQKASLHTSRQAPLPSNQRYDVVVFCVNADQTLPTRRRLGEPYLAGRKVAGLWFWELEDFPAEMMPGFDGVDEVWAATRFIQRALEKVSPVPVRYLPLPLTMGTLAEPLDPLTLGIPRGFYFLFTFDFFSVFRRKNPIALVEAFKLAFQEGEGPNLVIKCINGDRCIEQLEHLRYAIGGRKDIFIISQYLDADVNQQLMAACGCYVSLHRSEGLGLTIVDAMRYRKPVIATGYSGNMDFTNEENSYLCRYEMQPVGPDAHPYDPKAHWAEPDVQHAAELMREVYHHPDEAAKRANLAAEQLEAQYAPERCAEALEELYQQLSTLSMAASTPPPAPIPDPIRGSEDPQGDADNASLAHPEAAPAPAKVYKSSARLDGLQEQISAKLDVRDSVPDNWTILMQGPRRALKDILDVITRQRRKVDHAMISSIRDHDRRLARIEDLLKEIRDKQG